MTAVHRVDQPFDKQSLVQLMAFVFGNSINDGHQRIASCDQVRAINVVLDEKRVQLSHRFLDQFPVLI